MPDRLLVPSELVPPVKAPPVSLSVPPQEVPIPAQLLVEKLHSGTSADVQSHHEINDSCAVPTQDLVSTEQHQILVMSNLPVVYVIKDDWRPHEALPSPATNASSAPPLLAPKSPLPPLKNTQKVVSFSSDEGPKVASISKDECFDKQQVVLQPCARVLEKSECKSSPVKCV